MEVAFLLPDAEECRRVEEDEGVKARGVSFVAETVWEQSTHSSVGLFSSGDDGSALAGTEIAAGSTEYRCGVLAWIVSWQSGIYAGYSPLVEGLLWKGSSSMVAALSRKSPSRLGEGWMGEKLLRALMGGPSTGEV